MQKENTATFLISLRIQQGHTIKHSGGKDEKNIGDRTFDNYDRSVSLRSDTTIYEL